MTHRKAIVTGSASGIGAATVLALAAQGYDTVGIDRQLAGAVATAQAASDLGGKHHALLADVADEAQLVAVMAQAVQFLGGLDALATCAGVSVVISLKSIHPLDPYIRTLIFFFLNKCIYRNGNIYFYK